MKTFYLRKIKGEWQLREQGQKNATLKWSTKKEAVKASREYLKSLQKKLNKGVSLRISRADGVFQTEYTYTKKFDPKRSKG